MGIRMKNRLLDLMNEYEKARGRRIPQAEWARLLGVRVNTLKAWIAQDMKAYKTETVEGIAEFFNLSDANELFEFEVVSE